MLRGARHNCPVNTLSEISYTTAPIDPELFVVHRNYKIHLFILCGACNNYTIILWMFF
jgi:hypothetical protein